MRGWVGGWVFIQVNEGLAVKTRPYFIYPHPIFVFIQQVREMEEIVHGSYFIFILIPCPKFVRVRVSCNRYEAEMEPVDRGSMIKTEHGLQA